MTPEQKQLVRRIEERLDRGYSASQPTPDAVMQACDDLRDLLSLVKSQEAGGDLRDRDDVLAFFGATMKENGDLGIDMKKYHAAHLCQEHSFQPWRRAEIEEKCVMCLTRDRDNAATSMRSRCVEKVREIEIVHADACAGPSDYFALESVSIQEQK